LAWQSAKRALPETLLAKKLFILRHELLCTTPRSQLLLAWPLPNLLGSPATKVINAGAELCQVSAEFKKLKIVIEFEA
jgi:hypothetical protein